MYHAPSLDIDKCTRGRNSTNHIKISQKNHDRFVEI